MRSRLGLNFLVISGQWLMYRIIVSKFVPGIDQVNYTV